MKRLQQGFTAALDELYQRYARKLFVFCTHSIKTGGPQDAEDMVHDIFIRVIKAADTFDSEKALFRTWLFSIARNHCIDLGRRQRRFQFLPFAKKTDAETDQNTEDDLPDPGETVEDVVTKNATLAAVRGCIETLQNQDERQAFVLYYLAGKVFREIGEILGKSTSTAKNRVQAAQAQVRRCLEKKGIDSAF